MSILTKKIRLRVKKTYLNLFAPKYLNCTKVRSPEETLREIQLLLQKATRGAYLRFGDGEVNILHGVGAMEQQGNEKMAREMKEAFCLSGEGIIKSLMIHSHRFGFSHGMKEGFHLTSDTWAKNLLNLCYEYFIGERIYSHPALSYSLIYQRDLALEFFAVLKSHRRIIFVGNERIQKNLLEKLFGHECIHIKTNPTDAFSHINSTEQKIKEELTQRNGYTVIIFAAGPSSNILQKRIYENGFEAFTFDIGSVVDALSEVRTRAWMDDTLVPEHYYANFTEEVSKL